MESFFFFFCFSWSEYFVEKRIIECIEGVDHYIYLSKHIVKLHQIYGMLNADNILNGKKQFMNMNNYVYLIIESMHYIRII